MPADCDFYKTFKMPNVVINDDLINITNKESYRADRDVLCQWKDLGLLNIVL